MPRTAKHLPELDIKAANPGLPTMASHAGSSTGAAIANAKSTPNEHLLTLARCLGQAAAREAFAAALRAQQPNNEGEE
jgi:hypothetical protein